MYWDVYEIHATEEHPVVGVMFRGRIRKFCLEKNRNILLENATDAEKNVRFAVPAGEDPSDIQEYILKTSPDATFTQVFENIPNPILSKLQTNIEGRYTL